MVVWVIGGRHSCWVGDRVPVSVLCLVRSMLSAGTAGCWVGGIVVDEMVVDCVGWLALGVVVGLLLKV